MGRSRSTLDHLEDQPWWGAVEQFLHFLLGAAAGLATALVLFGITAAGWADPGWKHYVAAGGIGSALLGLFREFRQNFLQRDAYTGRYYVDVDRDEEGRDDNDYGDMVLDLLFTAAGGPVVGALFWIFWG